MRGPCGACGNVVTTVMARTAVDGVYYHERCYDNLLLRKMAPAVAAGGGQTRAAMAAGAASGKAGEAGGRGAPDGVLEFDLAGIGLTNFEPPVLDGEGGHTWQRRACEGAAAGAPAPLDDDVPLLFDAAGKVCLSVSVGVPGCARGVCRGA